MTFGCVLYSKLFCGSLCQVARGIVVEFDIREGKSSGAAETKGWSGGIRSVGRGASSLEVKLGRVAGG